MKKTYPKILCPRKGCLNLAVVDVIFGILPCQSCQARDARIKIRKSPEFYSINKMHRVQSQRDKHMADLEQPYVNNKINPSFAKIYKDKAKDYYSKQELEHL